MWCQPRGAFDAWPVGAVVAHAGRRWRNILPKVNVWEPGNDGPVPTWEELREPEPEVPAQAVAKHDDSGINPGADTVPDESRQL